MIRALMALMSCAGVMVSSGATEIDDAADLATQQQQERQVLDEMRQEINDIKGTMTDAVREMGKLQTQVQQRQSIREFHLAVKDAVVEVAPGVSTSVLAYNGVLPGPVLRVKEGEPVRIALHNQGRTSTSLLFHGVLLPHSVGGLPKKGAGMVLPGESYVYQFVAPRAGTYWYHPQVTHAEQMGKGLSGALIIESADGRRSYERDMVLVLGQVSGQKQGATAASTYFTLNGKTAPQVPPFEVHRGERIRFRVINTSSRAIPLHLTGHQFEVLAVNGSAGLEPHVTRDTITVNPGDRYDLEFSANNPGVWSFSSLLPEQASNDGKFPGGIAMVVRYIDAAN